MTVIDAFAPIVSDSARVLILGSMPSSASLARQQYYGHPRNAFWPVLGVLVGAAPELDYRQRQQILIDHGIAVWDVLQSCIRPGSLDANIAMDSVKINDFRSFFKKYRAIERVFFNGAMAEKLFRQQVLPGLSDCFNTFQYQRLPSTSPAHASLSLEQKINAWKVIVQPVLK
ncbi:MAG: DNA-deoxyinosine glycosylase [Gammaproteobacteria bacterium HGW-Gammaproteobacteria-3]|nr:MAG: DNA-deoxyinosine glycosylase [Gammaproteobacteria bacterium HGW-Gammaproteobacteria-3]